MKSKKHILIVLLSVATILFCFFNTIAQPYSFRHYQVENGLSNNAIYCSIQDKNGFMWFGTKDGLNRFDGYYFKTFRINNAKNSLVPDLIYCISADKNGTLWVGSSKGLCFYDYQKESLISVIDSLKEINSVQIDNMNQIWFISYSTLYRYNLQTHKLTKFPPSVYFPASSISMDMRGQIWVGTKDGFLQKFDAKTDRFKDYHVFAHSRKTSSHAIQKIYCLGNETVYTLHRININIFKGLKFECHKCL